MARLIQRAPSLEECEMENGKLFLSQRRFLGRDIYQCEQLTRWTMSIFKDENCTCTWPLPYSLTRKPDPGPGCDATGPSCSWFWWLAITYRQALSSEVNAWCTEKFTYRIKDSVPFDPMNPSAFKLFVWIWVLQKKLKLRLRTLWRGACMSV